MTEKLYYSDAYLFEFDAIVISCREHGDVFYTVLDRTAFFPLGGGQPGDIGYIGDVRVKDTFLLEDEIIHVTSAPLTEGEKVSCALDSEVRMQNMRSHSGEQVFTGILHGKYGFDNVGFHIGTQSVTIDFNGVLDAQQIFEIERLANEAVMQNIPVLVSYPAEAELKKLDYRSKKELSGQIRIVTIPGIDCCACCGTHVRSTGEIGLIRVRHFENYKGGIRIELNMANKAYEDMNNSRSNNNRISRLLSTKIDETSAGVSLLLEKYEQTKRLLSEADTQLLRLKCENLSSRGGKVCLFDSGLSGEDMISASNILAEKAKLAYVFSTSDNGKTWRYAVCSRECDVRDAVSAMNRSFSGKGGGKPNFVQGVLTGTKEDILTFLEY